MASITQALNQTNNEFNQALGKQKGSSLDKDSFMLLLVTQFKYQDPLNPMEDKEFIAQMAQFSSLEQLMNLNTSMEGLTEATNNQQMINATSYIGKQVTISGNSIGKVTEEKTDPDSGETSKISTITRFRYAPSDDAVSGRITVYDQSKNPIYTEELTAKNAGATYEFNWDGKYNNGSAAPDGVYTVNVSLSDAKGEAVLSDQVVDANVTGVVNNNGVVYLGLEGGQLMPLANVRQVMLPNTANPGQDTPSGEGENGGGEGEGSGESEGSGETEGSGESGGTGETGGTGESGGGAQGGESGETGGTGETGGENTGQGQTAQAA